MSPGNPYDLNHDGYGSIVGWKKGRTDSGQRTLIKLTIDGRVIKVRGCSKLRADSALVESIELLGYNGERTGKFVPTCGHSKAAFGYAPSALYAVHYVVGATFYPDGFDEKFDTDCGHGVHFFLDPDETIRFGI
jgi:hypothetical protein